MRGLVVLSAILVVMASFSFVAANISNGNNKKIEINENSKILEFSTFTSAVCENKEEVVHCKDEVFVNCNGKVSKVLDAAECNGFKLDVSKVSGAAVFGKDWRDPRDNTK